MLKVPSKYKQRYFVRPHLLFPSPSSACFAIRWLFRQDFQRAMVDEPGISPRRCYSTMAFHTHISPKGWKIGPLVAAIERRSLAPSAWSPASWSGKNKQNLNVGWTENCEHRNGHSGSMKRWKFLDSNIKEACTEWCKYNKNCETSGSHGSECEDESLLGYSAVEAVRTTVTLVYCNETTRHYIPEGSHLYKKIVSKP
jgi:hypothetical protein